MKLLFISGFVVVMVLWAQFFPSAPPALDLTQREAIRQKKLPFSGCSPDWSHFKVTDEEIKQMKPLPGTGTHSWKIKTTHDSAQFYFNQGINLYYGFHIIEAIPSFKKAQLFDSACAMLYWAEALAYGPNINDLGYAASPDALNATRKAVELSGKAAEKEKALIRAMQVRYSNDSSQKREYLNQLYADAMKKAFERFPTDPETGALCADALMLLHPWDLWERNGSPKAWTNEIVGVLEKVLKMAPDHPGANHYYIHTVEASPAPERANASAECLGRLTPGLSHMVHMPSHIYIRTGQYTKGIAVNKAAIEGYQKYLSLYPDVINNAPLYDFHNRHMQATCSMNGSDYTTALKDAQECRSSFDTSFLSLPAPLGSYIQFVYMTPVFTMIRFEKWDAILAEQKVESPHIYASLLQHFARGLAYANTGQKDKAGRSLSDLEALLNEPDLTLPMGAFSSAKEGAMVAKHILSGVIAEKENRFDEALAEYHKAVEAEDLLVYNEPRDWLLPARHFLGNFLLGTRQFKTAELVFIEDLKRQPNNPLSLTGLQAAMKQGK